MIQFFNKPWSEVPSCWLDTETTGIRPGIDRAVQVGLVRFEGAKPVAEFSSLVNPGIAIPAEATAIHGITDAMVVGAPTIAEVFALEEVGVLLRNAQPGGYHGSFDRQFLPVFTDPADWPWLDPLIIIREVDKYAPGTGRHRLDAVCKRHGIQLTKAHDALSDAGAAGVLFYKLVNDMRLPADRTLGELLRNLQQREALQWFDHWSWRSRQPPMEACNANRT